VRFRSVISLAFAPSELRSLIVQEERAPELAVAFFGVATPASYGSLPSCYSELILRRDRDGDRALRDFLDGFNHRLLSLFYRAWEKYRIDIAFESAPDDRESVFERSLFCLLGLGTEGIRDRLPFPDHALLRWAGVLGRRPVPAAELADLVGDHFDVAVRVEQFIPSWYRMEPGDRLRLDARSQRLGRDTFLGESVCVAQFRFRLELGPLRWHEYVEFLPTGTAFEALRQLVRFAVGAEYDFDIQLILKGEDASLLRLGGSDGANARLGWTTWLQSRPLERDPSDVVLSTDAHPLRSPSAPTVARRGAH
jgi:type VI secretion system protein ImpH